MSGRLSHSGRSASLVRYEYNQYGNCEEQIVYDDANQVIVPLSFSFIMTSLALVEPYQKISPLIHVLLKMYNFPLNAFSQSFSSLIYYLVISF